MTHPNQAPSPSDIRQKDVREALLPCPFCGGEAKMRESKLTHDTWFVQCTECENKTVTSYHKIEPTESWNTRAALSAQTGEPQLPLPGMKLTYIKRWRTIVQLPEKYASEIVEALSAQTGEPVSRRGAMAAQWTYDPEAEAYYFAPMQAAKPPYLQQRHVDAIIDIASDGTLAGVELIDNMPPPPLASPPPQPDTAPSPQLQCLRCGTVDAFGPVSKEKK